MSNVSTVSSGPSWQLDKFAARFETPRVSGSCDLRNPEQGIQEIAVDASPLDQVRLLGLSLPVVGSDAVVANLEAYTRCGDLVGIYAPTINHPFRSQAYWRLASHDVNADHRRALAAIELVASKQTDLLDSRPDLSIGSHLSSTAILHLVSVESGRFNEINFERTVVLSRQDAVGCFLFRLPGDRLSYAEMVYPLDFETTKLEMAGHLGEDRVVTRHHLFANRLEKGVILRARVLGLFLSRQDDLQTAAAHYAQFAASNPPLTT
jgi:hypothetical protein